jgi:hypothetical protein
MLGTVMLGTVMVGTVMVGEGRPSMPWVGTAKGVDADRRRHDGWSSA